MFFSAFFKVTDSKGICYYKKWFWRMKNTSFDLSKTVSPKGIKELV